jgi:hypothetical protein
LSLGPPSPCSWPRLSSSTTRAARGLGPAQPRCPNAAGKGNRSTGAGSWGNSKKPIGTNKTPWCLFTSWPLGQRHPG